MKAMILALAFLVTGSAFGYQTLIGSDPSAVAVKEYKQVQKSTNAGEQDAILAAGELLSYDATDLTNAYIVTRVGTGASGGNGQTAVTGSHLIAGVATKAVATGDTGYFLVQTRGYATVKYDATGNGNAIAVGNRLCANAVGAAVKCLHEASASKVIALEAAAHGSSGSALKVLLSAD